MTNDEWMERQERRERERDEAGEAIAALKRQVSVILTPVVSRLNDALERAICAIEARKSRSIQRLIAERERKNQR